ncbi:hypothetical protein SSX86_001906 [Deinandra increscens subsp. villosa]|uniref:Glutaredoxin-like protein n=1 Tax=Deinandra increscens subsp. villosa TaxID=3103831 RepID=A0AAP0DSC0_9ASTR
MTIAAAAAAAAIVLLPARRSTILNSTRRRLNVTSCNYSSSSASRKQLILYSKPGCCLCDGLKEKLHSAFSLSDSFSLHDVDLQIRDISSNPEWEKAYQYEIPVLTRLRSDGTEEVIPRFSPRAGVDHIQSKLAAVLSRDN